MVEAGSIDNPILNGPYDAPALHFELGSNGPTGTVLDGRRPSESFIPVPAPRKGKNKSQQTLDFDITGERREVNQLVNDIRYEVNLWDHVGQRLPKRRGKKAASDQEWVPPDTLEGAMRSLCRSERLVDR